MCQFVAGFHYSLIFRSIGCNYHIFDTAGLINDHTERFKMNDEESGNEDDVSFMQQLLDNPFALLFIGILVPTVTYLIWGIVELVSLPIAK